MDSRTPCLTRCATSPPFRCCRKSWKSRLTKTLCSSNRPPIRPDGWTRTRRSEGIPSAERPTGRTSRLGNCGEESPSGTGEPDQTAWRRVPNPTFDGLAVFQTRTFFYLPRRRSSGYFSSDGDSTPSSPLSPRPPSADSATQTPSPSGQVMLHALECLGHRLGGVGARARLQRHGEHMQPAAEPMEAGGGMLLAPLLPRQLLIIHP